MPPSARPSRARSSSVARAAADAAVERAPAAGRAPATCFTAAAAAAREALARTPEQLAGAAQAGVVDAGGRGLCVVLDAAETAVTGRGPTPVGADRQPPHPGAAAPGRRPHRGRPGATR